MNVLFRGLYNLKRDPIVSIITLPRAIINYFRQRKIDVIISKRKEYLRENANKIIKYDIRYAEYVKYYLENDVSIFNNDFEKKYQNDNILEIKHDGIYKYIMHNGNKLFFPWYYKHTEIANLYRSILIEQDINSPHRYLYEGDSLDDCIFIDCGSAEASLPLDIVEKAKKIYLFEAEKKWIKPLNKTFERWKNKVIIENKYVSNMDSKKTISLKKYIERLADKKEIDLTTDNIYIKMDIEGYEEIVFEDLISIIKDINNIHIALCVYHKKDSEENILNMIPDGFQAIKQDKYMLFLYETNGFEFPFFRRGIIRVERL